jgi:hypothetical protein
MSSDRGSELFTLGVAVLSYTPIIWLSALPAVCTAYQIECGMLVSENPWNVLLRHRACSPAQFRDCHLVAANFRQDAARLSGNALQVREPLRMQVNCRSRRNQSAQAAAIRPPVADYAQTSNRGGISMPSCRSGRVLKSKTSTEQSSYQQLSLLIFSPRAGGYHSASHQSISTIQTLLLRAMYFYQHLSVSLLARCVRCSRYRETGDLYGFVASIESNAVDR